MYLISAYFDEATEKRINKYIKAIEARTGGSFISDRNIPPHMTVARPEPCASTDRLIANIDRLTESGAVASGGIYAAALGIFKPRVLFIAPVLNEYLHGLSVALCGASADAAAEEGAAPPTEKTGALPKKTAYEPFNWMPHITIARGLTEPQMRLAFSCMQADFEAFYGRITAIGLAQSRPYHDIKKWKL